MLVAEELGYRPNAIARGLITNRSNMVAVVISNLTNLHYPEVLSELTARFSKRDIRVLLFTLQQESEIDEILDQIWRYRVDGAIVAARLSGDQVRAFDQFGIPLVLYNREVINAPATSVMCASGQGEQLLVDGMLSAGARKFAIIAGPSDSTVGEARVAAALEQLHANGINNVIVDRGDFSYESGFAASVRILKNETVDAIIAANDVMALGAIDAARDEFGLVIPHDLSVVGFDGVAPAAWRAYRLTTVRQPLKRMTDAAVSMLLERIEDPLLGPERRVFSGDLIKGASAKLA